MGPTANGRARTYTTNPGGGPTRPPAFLPEPLEPRVLMSGAGAAAATTAARAAPVQVAAVTVNGGVAVRAGAATPAQSMLTSVAVRFTGNVSITPAALSLRNLTRGSTLDPTNLRLAYSPATRTATWTFPNLVGGSLVDGTYAATVRALLVTGPDGRPIDGDGDGAAGGDRVARFARLFGDADGDGAVTPADVIAFRAASRTVRGMPRYQARFDLNADGAVSNLDSTACLERFGTVLDEITPSSSSAAAAGAAAATDAPGPAAAQRAVVTTPAIKTVTIQARRRQTDAWSNFSVRTLPAGLTMASTPLSRYGGDASRKVAATGYFRAQKVNGRWWLVDPEGCLYFDNSVTSVEPRVFPDNAAEFVARFGRGRAGAARWADWVRNWVREIGYASAGPWGTPAVQAAAGRKTNYTLMLDLMGTFALGRGYATYGTGHNSYRNGVIPVFDPAFPGFCRTFMTKLLAQQRPGLDPRSDPYLVGYMTDNELPWATSTLDAYLALPATDPNGKAARAWLAARGTTTPAAADRTAFLTHVADTYFRITSQAIRAYDPNHMVLGCRLLGGDGRKTYLLKAARRHVDVASVNFYDNMDPGRTLEPAAAAADLPFLVSEFYAKGADSGLPNTAGYGYTVKTQADRGRYYQQVLLSVLGSPHGVGAAWLALTDNDLSDPNPEPSNLDANKGLMTVHYPPTAAGSAYQPLTDRIRDVTRNLYPLAHFLRGA